MHILETRFCSLSREERQQMQEAFELVQMLGAKSQIVTSELLRHDYFQRVNSVVLHSCDEELNEESAKAGPQVRQLENFFQNDMDTTGPLLASSFQ